LHVVGKLGRWFVEEGRGGRQENLKNHFTVRKYKKYADYFWGCFDVKKEILREGWTMCQQGLTSIPGQVQHRGSVHLCT
jgi:hypothetical protein